MSCTAKTPSSAPDSAVAATVAGAQPLGVLVRLRSALLALLARQRDERSLPELIESFPEAPAAAFKLISSI